MSLARFLCTGIRPFPDGLTTMCPFLNRVAIPTLEPFFKFAVVVLVTKFNGFVIRACAEHLLQYAEIINKGTESDEK